MVFKSQDLGPVELKMWESTAMKDSDMVKDSSGKTHLGRLPFKRD